MKPIVLASASPRRRDLLALLNVPFDVIPSNIVEDSMDGSRPELVVRRLAREKAEAARLRDRDPAVLAADTIVVYAGENDLAHGKTPDRVRQDFLDLIQFLRRPLPDCRIA